MDTTMLARLREFWETDEPLRILAREWGCSTAYISTLAKQEGLPSRRPRIQAIRAAGFARKFKDKIGSRKYLEAEAAKRNVTPWMLEYLLIQTISNDRMVDAVLDDADQYDQPVTAAA